MALLSRKKQLAAKVEGTKGSAETLTAAELIPVENLSFSYTPEELVRNIYRSTISTTKSIPGAKLATITCRCELKGSGTATTPPKWATLARACGLNESVNTANVTYTVDSDDADTDTLTMAVYEDGLCSKLYGARGNMSINFAANQIVYAEFTFTGIFVSRTDAALLSPEPSDTVPPIWKGATVAFNFGSAYSSAVLSNITLDLNNTVTVRQDANETDGLSYALITARDPGGTMDPDLVLVATHNWLSFLNTPTLGTASWVLGSGAGGTLSFSAPKMQVIPPGTTGDRDGIATEAITYKLRMNAGDDELVITHS